MVVLWFLVPIDICTLHSITWVKYWNDGLIPAPIYMWAYRSNTLLTSSSAMCNCQSGLEPDFVKPLYRQKHGQGQAHALILVLIVYVKIYSRRWRILAVCCVSNRHGNATGVYKYPINCHRRIWQWVSTVLVMPACLHNLLQLLVEITTLASCIHEWHDSLHYWIW